MKKKDADEIRQFAKFFAGQRDWFEKERGAYPFQAASSTTSATLLEIADLGLTIYKKLCDIEAKL